MTPELTPKSPETGTEGDPIARLQADLDALQKHLRRAEDSCRALNRIVNGLYRAMEAARIELAQGDACKAMAWVVATMEDVSDAPEVEWNGAETAQEWWTRTDAFYSESTTGTQQ